MWINIFYRHLRKSVKNQPLQPLLSVLILTLSLAIAFMALNVFSWLQQETENRQTAQYGIADLTVTLNGKTENRLLLPDAAIQALDCEGVAVAGSYELPLYLADGSLAFGVGVDFEEIGNIFPLSFSAYGEITTQTVNESALVTADFAKDYNLSPGDEFAVEVLGFSKTYTVQGISEREFMGNYAVMLSVYGVVQLLAQTSPFVAAMGDGFALYSTLYISMGNEDVAAAALTLRQSAAFSDKTVSVVTDLLVAQSNFASLASMISILVVFVSFLAATVIFCCFYILSARRAQDSALFTAAGAPPRTLLFLQCTEIMFYWLIGSALGVAAVYALTPATIALCGFRYLTSPFNAAFLFNGGKGLAITFATSLCTALCFYFTERAKTRKKPFFRLRGGRTLVLLVLAVLTVATLICAAATPAALHKIFAIACAASALALVFVGLPPLYRSMANGWLCAIRRRNERAERAEKAIAPAICLTYALKNARKVHTLHNSCRLMVLLLSVSAALAAVIASGYRYVDATTQIFPADYMLLNVSESTAADVAALDSVEQVIPIYWGSALNDEGYTVQVVSVTDAAALAPLYRPDELPVGNGAVVSKSYAVTYGLTAGDSLSVVIEGVEAEFYISQVINSPFACIYFDGDAMGFAPNVLSVKGAAGVTKEALKADIASAMALEMALIVSISDFSAQRIAQFDVYLKCGNLLFIFMLLFSLTGLIDNLFESYRARREEFALYRNCGMTTRHLARMKLCEIGVTLLFSLLASVLLSAFLIFVIHCWMQSFSIDLLFLLFCR